MTREESKLLIEHKKKNELEFGFILIIAFLSMSALITYWY